MGNFVPYRSTFVLFFAQLYNLLGISKMDSAEDFYPSNGLVS